MALDRSLDWEWVLSSGGQVKATLDLRKGIESVWLAKRLVSRAPVGTKADGHVVPLPTGGPYRGEVARVTFDVDARTCTFHVGADALPATLFPGGPRPARNFAQWSYVAIALVAVAGAGVAIAPVVAAHRAAAEVDPDAPLSLSFPSPDGLLVAHFPTGFSAEVEKGNDESQSALKVALPSTAAVVGFISTREPRTSNAEQLARSMGSAVGQEWTELSSNETSGPCFGERGVIGESRVRKGLGEARRWSCTFIHNGHGYHVFYLLPNGSSAARETTLRRIVEGTELTGEAPPPSTTVASSPPEVRIDGEPSSAGNFRFPSSPAPARTIPSQPVIRRPPFTPPTATARPRTPPNDPPRSRDNIVCDGTGACFGSGPPPSSKGVVRGR